MRWLALVPLALALALATPAAADEQEEQYRRALEAYDRGDVASALNDFQTLAEAGVAAAQFNLGALYERGRGVPFDPKEAAHWYERAAAQGHVRAQFNLGLMYTTGRGVAQDPGEAARWFREAASRGNMRAQLNLGVMSYYGNGVTQDLVEAARWFRMAADQGDPRAQFYLGAMHAEGDGVAQDFVQAHLWASLALARFPPSEERARAAAVQAFAAERLSPEKLALARLMASKWLSTGELWQVQGRLKELGYYEGEIDGLIGPGSRAAIRAYERERGLPETGEATPALLRLLSETE